MEYTNEILGNELSNKNNYQCVNEKTCEISNYAYINQTNTKIHVDTSSFSSFSNKINSALMSLRFQPIATVPLPITTTTTVPTTTVQTTTTTTVPTTTTVLTTTTVPTTTKVLTTTLESKIKPIRTTATLPTTQLIKKTNKISSVTKRKN